MMRLLYKSAVVLMIVYCVFGSQCPHSSDSEKKFKIFLKEENWFASLLHCSSHNMTLATIVSQQEQDRVKNLIKETVPNNGFGRYWLGGADLDTEKGFIWFSTGEPINYHYFRPGQPDNQRHTFGDEDCVELIVGDIWNNYNWNYEWNDSICKHKHYFICEHFD